MIAIDWTFILLLLYFLLLAFLMWIAWPIVIGAIYLPTPPEIVLKMLEISEISKEDTLYDIGSGDGRIIIQAAEKYGARAIGIEADPLRVLLSRFKIWRSPAKEKLHVKWGDFFKTNISDATVITVYQGESINIKLKEKFERELKKGTKIVSNSFTFKGWKTVKELPEQKIYLYVLSQEDQSIKKT